MTTRLKGLIVALETDVREDDAESLINAVRRLRGVLSVEPVEATSADHIVEQRVRRDLELRLLIALKR